jgi:DNA (cytosine-5)-methyltransferase 1
VLDAQYFGVAQRRRRVFVIGCLGDAASAAAVLLEREGLSGHPSPSRKEGQKTSSYVQGRLAGGSDSFPTLTAMQGEKQWLGNQEALSGNYHVICPTIAPCLETQAGSFRQPDVQAYVVGSLPASLGKGIGHNKDEFITADKGKIRRITPIECERLQGFQDNFTRIPWRNKQEDDCPDGPRYKALGNSMAVPVMNWIGKRINEVEKINGEK